MRVAASGDSSIDSSETDASGSAQKLIFADDPVVRHFDFDDNGPSGNIDHLRGAKSIRDGIIEKDRTSRFSRELLLSAPGVSPSNHSSPGLEDDFAATPEARRSKGAGDCTLMPSNRAILKSSYVFLISSAFPLCISLTT
jgi:hypothetical protein